MYRNNLGICQWFHYGDTATVLTCRSLLRELRCKHLRLDLSWADYHRPNGKMWYAWLFETMKEFDLLVCVWHTPPSISRNGKTNGAPMELQQFAMFIDEIIKEYGSFFESIELWNEPNNRLKWDIDNDPSWKNFAAMIIEGARVAKLHWKTTVMGGMSPIDNGWLTTLIGHTPTILDYIDVIAVHAFPGQWNEPQHIWNGWQRVIDHMEPYTKERSLWVTEVGVSATMFDQKKIDEQIAAQVAVSQYTQQIERIYWYSLMDLPFHKAEIEITIGGFEEPLEHSLGLVTEGGIKKPSFFTMQSLLAERNKKI